MSESNTPDDAAATIAKQQESIEALERQIAKVIGENRKLKRSSEISPDDFAAETERADRAEKERDELAKQIKAMSIERDKAVQAHEKESAFTQKLLIQDGIKSALIANGVKDEDYIDSLAAKFSQGATIVVNGDAREAMLGDKKLADAIKEWAGTDAGKKFVAAPLNGGGGAPGGGGAGGGKTMATSDFNALGAKERAAFMSSGGTLTDQAA